MSVDARTSKRPSTSKEDSSAAWCSTLVSSPRERHAASQTNTLALRIEPEPEPEIKLKTVKWARRCNAVIHDHRMSQDIENLAELILDPLRDGAS